MSHSNKIREVCYLLGYDSNFTVDRDSRSDGLAVIWKSSIQYNIINYSSNFINLQVYDSDRGNWRLTSFSGYDESMISVLNIIFGFVLFRFNFVLFNNYFLLELFYFNCKLFNFRNKYSKDSILEQKKEDSELIWAGKYEDSTQKYDAPKSEA